MKALDKRPEGRFPDARTFARALRECVRRSRAPSMPPPRPTRPDLAASAAQAADGRLAQGSDCGASAHRAESLDAPRPAIAEPQLLGSPPQREVIVDSRSLSIGSPGEERRSRLYGGRRLEDSPPQRGSSSLKVVKKATRSATSCSVKPK